MKLFKNATIYKISKFNTDGLEQVFKPFSGKELEPQQPYMIGFSELTLGNTVTSIGHNHFFSVKIQKKILPKKVINRLVKEKMQRDNLPRSAKEKVEQDIYCELAPKALIDIKEVGAYIDSKNGLLVIDSASASELDCIVHLLFIAIPDLKEVKPVEITTPENITCLLAAFANDPDHIFGGFNWLGSATLAETVDKGKVKANLAPDESIEAILDNGWIAESIGLYKDQEIVFTLTPKSFKSIKFDPAIIGEAIGESETKEDKDMAGLFLMVNSFNELFKSWEII